MTDNPQDESRESRRAGRTGPLGEDPEATGGSSGTGGSIPRESGGEDETRQIPTDSPASDSSSTDPDGETRPVETNRSAGTGTPSEEKETRVIRTDAAREDDTLAGGRSRRDRREGRTTSSGQDSASYPRGYFEAAEEREDRLRDIYGGVDPLASFLGFVFAVVAGGILFALLSLVFVPLGISVDFAGAFDAAAITALALLAVLIFVTYLLGGYVSGRLARFDGGRNGAMCVLWTVLVGFVLFVAGTFLPGTFGENVRNFYQETLIPTFNGLVDLGLLGVGIGVGAVIVAVLGGIVGGKLGARYHSEIDHTT